MIPLAYIQQAKTASPALCDLVAFLSDKSAYDFHPSTVEARETHMSWVFLAGDYVFKIKKPVHTSSLDFSTLKARKKFCEEEVRLNKRLAPDVYLNAIPITLSKEGELSIDGGGAVVEWLVKMRRLPDERMLDQAIKDRTASSEDVQRLFSLLFSFFERAEPFEVDEKRYLATFRDEHAQSKAILLDANVGIASEAVRRLVDDVQDILEDPPGWLLEPINNHRIIEGHGDLRPEHICLINPPVIIDCLEFNPDLRRVDPFDELSYLALELRLLGAEDMANSIVPQFMERTGARPPQALLDFYAVYRAIIRARLALGHLLDPPPQDFQKWEAHARAYLGAANEAIVRLFPPKVP